MEGHRGQWKVIGVSGRSQLGISRSHRGRWKVTVRHQWEVIGVSTVGGHRG